MIGILHMGGKSAYILVSTRPVYYTLWDLASTLSVATYFAGSLVLSHEMQYRR